ncbi:MAG: flagellar protein FlaG [Waltera sp.]
MKFLQHLLIFQENLPIPFLENKGRAPTEGAFISHGGDHYDHRTDFQSPLTVQAQNTSAVKNATTKVTTEENASEYNSANVKPIDKIDQTTAVVENAQGKEQSNTSADPNGEQQQHVTNEQIKKAVEKLNKSMMSHSEAVFGIHEATNRVTIKIIDKDTKKVIKELPPEKTLDMIAKVWELAGILVDEKR